jgi:hypothetical protein
MKANKTMSRQALSNHRRRRDKESESSIDSAAHNQSFKQQKQLNNRNHHIYIKSNTECQWTQLPHQKTPWQIGLKRKIQQSVVYRGASSLTETDTGLW